MATQQGGGGGLGAALLSILSKTNHGTSAKSVLQQLLDAHPKFRSWFLANEQAIINAANAGTTRLDSVVFAWAAFQVRHRYSVSQAGQRMDNLIEQGGGTGWGYVLGQLGLPSFDKGHALHSYTPAAYPTQGGGQAPGVPGGIDKHTFGVYWGQLNDVYRQWLGRAATHAEATKAFTSGISFHGIQQQLIMSKEFVGTQAYKQSADFYNYVLAKFMATPMKVTPKMIQSWTAHGYTEGDVQAYVHAHPTLYMHTNEFQTNHAQLTNTFQSVMGYLPNQVKPGLVDKRVMKTVRTLVHGVDKNGHPTTQVVVKRVPTIVKVAGPNTMLSEITKAALHFNSPDQFQAWLRKQPMYASSFEHQRANQGSVADAGLSLNPAGRPVQQAMLGAPTNAANPAGGTGDVPA